MSVNVPADWSSSTGTSVPYRTNTFDDLVLNREGYADLTGSGNSRSYTRREYNGNSKNTYYWSDGVDGRYYLKISNPYTTQPNNITAEVLNMSGTGDAIHSTMNIRCVRASN